MAIPDLASSLNDIFGDRWSLTTSHCACATQVRPSWISVFGRTSRRAGQRHKVGRHWSSVNSSLSMQMLADLGLDQVETSLPTAVCDIPTALRRYWICTRGTLCGRHKNGCRVKPKGYKDPSTDLGPLYQNPDLDEASHCAGPCR